MFLYHFKFEFIFLLLALLFQNSTGMLQLKVLGWKVIELDTGEEKFNSSGMHDSCSKYFSAI